MARNGIGRRPGQCIGHQGTQTVSEKSERATVGKIPDRWYQLDDELPHPEYQFLRPSMVSPGELHGRDLNRFRKFAGPISKCTGIAPCVGKAEEHLGSVRTWHMSHEPLACQRWTGFFHGISTRRPLSSKRDGCRLALTGDGEMRQILLVTQIGTGVVPVLCFTARVGRTNRQLNKLGT